MTTRKPISWFLTETGRTFSFYSITAIGITAATLKFTPNTFFLYKYKEFVYRYSNGRPVNLHPDLRKRVDECMDILKLPESSRKLVQPFSVFGFDLFNAGSFKSKFGVAIGIPANFTYKSIKDFENDKVQVNQKEVNLESPIGAKLAEALLLPEKVQKFAICREILATNNFKMFLETSYPFVCTLLLYTVSQSVNIRFNLYQAPKLLRGVIYSLSSLFAVGLYFFFKDFTEVYYETSVDKQLCELGPDFIESGVIFYDKMLKRNQALRELMGSEGERSYSKLGNENFVLRQRRTPLIHRKLFFESKLKELENTAEEQTEE